MGMGMGKNDWDPTGSMGFSWEWELRRGSGKKSQYVLNFTCYKSTIAIILGYHSFELTLFKFFKFAFFNMSNTVD